MFATIWAALFGRNLESLFKHARKYGSCTLNDEQGAGWYFAICPPTSDRVQGRERHINNWSGRQPTVRAAVLEAIAEAEGKPYAVFNQEPCVPKLGGREFDE